MHGQMTVSDHLLCQEKQRNKIQSHLCSMFNSLTDISTKSIVSMARKTYIKYSQ
jgi:hypothetical protein